VFIVNFKEYSKEMNFIILFCLTIIVIYGQKAHTKPPVRWIDENRIARRFERAVSFIFGGVFD
jgi:hypothetical protein